jgi:formylglycine-generating enzyme required for sulfatase activity
MPSAPIYTQTLPNGTTFDLIEVPAGSFFIGGSDHEIHLRAFCIGKYPVTQALWLSVMGGENPAYFKGDNRPVEYVNWYDAAAFCNALNAQCGYQLKYFKDAAFHVALAQKAATIKYPNSMVFVNPDHQGYRLPSEAEWEYAAIGAQKKAAYAYAGGKTLDELGWYNNNSHGQTQPVGLKLANRLGLHDLSGNVWEWCEDQYQRDGHKIPKDGSPWLKEYSGAGRVLRGGGWGDGTQYCRPSYRFDSDPSTRLNGYPVKQFSSFGFRVVFYPPPVSWPV